MKIYELKLDKPKWFFDPPTNRQIKVLRFFGVEITPDFNKGRASGYVTRLFSNEENKQLWENYVYYTGDDSQDTSDLQPYDLNDLKAVVIPDDWKPKRAAGIPSDRKKRLLEMVTQMLREGSPFDDPLPDIGFNGKAFAFTGTFTSGSRKECQGAVKDLGAVGQSSVNLSTDYLVIGNEGSEQWAEGSHGRKIEKAMMLRMETAKPAILSEAVWLAALQ